MTRFLALTVLAVATVGVATSRSRSVEGPAGACPEAECPSETPVTPPRPGTVEISSSEACVDAGYLCSELEWADSLRLLRWPRDQGTILVYVPQPENESSEVARKLQRSASRGILAWSEHPFPIRVVERASALSREPDVTIRWSSVLEDSRLGQARVAWRGKSTGVEYSVTDFALVTRHPFHRRVLTEREVELTAAHEMGHALGLPHSDAERDVMYPENTASHLSARDFRTMEAVYRLANGALVVR